MARERSALLVGKTTARLHTLLQSVGPSLEAAGADLSGLRHDYTALATALEATTHHLPLDAVLHVPEGVEMES